MTPLGAVLWKSMICGNPGDVRSVSHETDYTAETYSWSRIN